MKASRDTVVRHFDRDAHEWAGIYERDDLLARRIQHRLGIALRFVDSLALPPGSSVLEVGCGAGLLAIALAQRGFEVHATDPAPGMRELTRLRAAQARVSDRVHVLHADVTRLSFRSGQFDLAVALGVLPWISQPATGVAELARVVRPGGHVIVSVSNRASLAALLDPARLPALAPARTFVRRLTGRIGGIAQAPRALHSHRKPQLARLLAASSLTIVNDVAFGFGPITWAGRVLGPDEKAAAFARRLDRQARRHRWFGDRFAEQYVALARRDVAPRAQS